MMFESVTALGNANPADPASVNAAIDSWERTDQLLRLHHMHEEEYGIVDLIKKRVPELEKEMEEQHEHVHGEMDALTAVAAKRDIGELFWAASSFVGTYLKHMQFEESVIMPALVDRCAPEEILQVHHQTVSKISPQAILDFLGHMLPAMNVFERCGMIGGMKKDVPAPFFEQIMTGAAKVLSAEDFNEMKTRIEA